MSQRSRQWLVGVWTVVGCVVLLAGLYHLLERPLHIVVPPLTLAVVIVYLLDPVVTGLQRFHVPRLIGAVLAYIVVGGVVFGLGWILLPIVAEQVNDLVSRTPDMAAAMERTINAQLPRFGVAGNVDVTSGTGVTDLSSFFESNQEGVVGLLKGAGSLVVSVLEGLVTIVGAPFIAFYLLVDRPRLTEGMARLVPPATRDEVVDVAHRVGRTVGAYFRGQIVVALFVGTGTALGLSLLGLPFWAIVGAVAGVFNLIPFVGPFVGGAFGVLVALTAGSGPGQAVAVVVVMTIVQQIDNHVITPSILSRTVRVHPVTIIIILASAASLFGVLGMLVVIPVFAAAKLVLMYVLVTRVPSMRHLAGEGGAIIDGVPVGEASAGSLVGMGRDLRAAWETRRRG